MLVIKKSWYHFSSAEV